MEPRPDTHSRHFPVQQIIYAFSGCTTWSSSLPWHNIKLREVNKSRHSNTQVPYLESTAHSRAHGSSHPGILRCRRHRHSYDFRAAQKVTGEERSLTGSLTINTKKFLNI